MIDNLIIIGVCLAGAVSIGYGTENFFLGLGTFLISVIIA